MKLWRWRGNGAGYRTRGLVSVLAALMLLGLAPGAPAAAAPGDVGLWKIYPPGWNLVAGPGGSRLGLHGEILLDLDGASGSYTRSDSPIAQAGQGYWVYYGGGAMLLLVGTPLDVSVAHVLGGHWATIGNSGTRPAAVRGADLVLAYEPGAGFAAVSSIPPGQAALVYADTDADVMLDPYMTPPLSASALPRTAPLAPPALPAVQPAGATPMDELNYLLGLGPLLDDAGARLGNFADSLETADPARPADSVWTELRDDASAVARDLDSLKSLPTPPLYTSVQADLITALGDISDGMRSTIDGLLGGQPQRVTLGSGLLASGARRLVAVQSRLP